MGKRVVFLGFKSSSTVAHHLLAVAAHDATTTIPPALPVCPCSAEDVVPPRFDKCFIAYAVSVSLSSLSLSRSLASSPSYMHTAECFQSLASFFTECCFSVSQAFDVCLDCCSSASLGRDHRQHLLICRFSLTPEGPLAAGPPCLFFFMVSI